ncbi:catalase [Pleurocapsa sp. PCC 7319]|uniref:catalase n=1 Tax=Pleurocapsa sp. PCC 7319 TaxID=118161 RepID=UPI000345B913|nr:catalase [Pleurocapsa sp. PCC 7319]
MSVQISHHPLEIIPKGEAEMIERVTKIQLEMMKNEDPQKRGQHPKQQALLRGIFEISDSVPESMRVGIFAEPKKFDALLRLSTGTKPKDSDPNSHGFSIKLLDVPGSSTNTQDFIFLDQPTFFIRDMAEYVTFFNSVQEDKGASYFKNHPREFGLVMTFNVVITSHLERQYWSTVPSAMGKNNAARFTLIPDPGNVSELPPVTTPDGLREVLEDYFVKNRKSAKFLFAAQGYIDEKTTPIEDATSTWSSPFENIATLTIPAQDFTAPEQFEFCENLSYNPWHCTSDHQPLGGIQRCRKLVYEEGARLRHELNNAQNSEPTKADYDQLGSFL